MDKVLVEIISPATSRHYDFWISKKMRVGQTVQKIADEIRRFEGNGLLFSDTGDLGLYDAKTERALAGDDTMEQAGIRSGDVLLIL